MKFVTRVINGFLRVCATGRVPKVGKLFRVSPWLPDTLVLHDFPNNGNSPYNCRRFVVDPQEGASFLVLKVQEDVPLWDLWIQVLYCTPNKSSREETVIGWLSYLEFNRMVLVEWDRWEEERNQPENSS